MITLNGTTGITNDGGYTGDGVVFADTTPANTLVTTTGGNVGIGTSSPGVYKLTVAGVMASLVDGKILSLGQDGVNASIAANTQLLFYSNGANATIFHTNGTERARIDSSGNLLVGTTSTPTAGTNGISVQTAGQPIVRVARAGTGGQDHAQFMNSNGVVGSISTSASSTTYSTSSDYRLKEAIAPMTGALARVAALRPCTYKWKVDGSDGQGFIAHELAEVIAGCVTGEKDAVDSEGNPQYQGIDTSFLVATLTAAIQELRAIVDAQGAEIAALKGTQP